MIKIEKSDLKIIKKISKKFSVTFYAYGSRVKGTNKKFSDLDLVIKDFITDENFFLIKEYFASSDISIKIDLHKLKDLNKDFIEKLHFEKV